MSADARIDRVSGASEEGQRAGAMGRADRARIILVGGGARSGKSAFARARAQAMGGRRVFVATAQAFDAEMERRIAAHVLERGAEFRTLEVPLDLPEALSALRDVDVVLVDCLTLWLSNLLLREDPETRVLEQVEQLAEVLERRAFHAIVVTNEVGMGLVPETPLGRLFRDVSGRAHQRLAGISDEVYFAVLGSVLRIRPEPVVAVQP